MRTLVRTLIAVFLATAWTVVAAVPAVRAHAQEVHQQSVRTYAAGSHQLTVSIDQVSPSYATPDATITVRGTVTNDTGSPITGLQVQLLSSTAYFVGRSDMDSYAAGQDTQLILYPEGSGASLTGTLHSGTTARWSASFTALSAGYPGSGFVVYPLAAQAVYADGSAAGIDRTFLPYWPGSGAATPLSVAWIWPLIDTPQQGVCPATLATNSLAASLGTKGRLGTLLAAGSQWAQQDHLTWAVDPALLSDANVMTHSYEVGGDASCLDRTKERASGTATTWLSTLRDATSTEPTFVTPYADADIAALTRAGLDQNMSTAYHLGDSVASRVLSHPVSTAVAWPADGTADASVLTSFVRYGGSATVVLSSNELPSSDGPYDNALNAAKTQTGSTMGVLLADSAITSVLGSASASSPAAAQFGVEQDFLAQTAMILAEGPNLQRSLVIAPPQRWDPSAAEAGALLSLTNSAPWLRTADLSTLAAAASKLPAAAALPASRPASGELGTDYTSQIGAVNESAALYKDLLYRPGPNALNQIDAAVTATTSAAWRGAGAAGGWLALRKLGSFLVTSEKKVQIITGKKILLGGSSGTTPVSVQNLLPVEVQVRVVATPAPGGQLSVGKFKDLIPVPALKTATVRVPLHTSAISTTTMQLQLQTENGSPLTWTSQSLSVQATRYGRALLILIAAALGVLVLASVARWIRRRLTDGTAQGRRAQGRSGGTG